MTLEQLVTQIPQIQCTNGDSDEKSPISASTNNPSAQTLRKYFSKWRKIAKKKDLIVSDRESEKLDEFIENLKCYKNEKQLSRVVATKPESEANNQIIESAQSFKNRYKSQKKIIEVQRSKIENQTKIINELKLGIIREDLLKSMESTKIEIRDIFNNCSGRLLIKAPLLQPPENRDKIMILSQKAPNVLQKMQQRAIERAQYRNIILERKKLIEETRQKLLEEAIEKKKVLEEEERKRNLEAINEQRRKDLLSQKRRLERKQEFESKCRLAKQFYEHLLVKQSFRKLQTNYNKAQEHQTLAEQFYIRKQKVRVFNVWFRYVDSQYKEKYEIADAHFAFKIVKKAFQTIREYKMEMVRALQVAEDWYDFKLTNNTFVHWHRYVCKQVMLDRKKNQIAERHNSRRLLFQYFYQWRSLPVVIQLEKAKEAKKRKWREKVWEILPDFQPSEE